MITYVEYFNAKCEDFALKTGGHPDDMPLPDAEVYEDYVGYTVAKDLLG